jgi:positive regulator of sigma E activity
VEIGIPPARVVYASLLGYVMPVLAMVVGGFAGAQGTSGDERDVGAAIGAFSGLALALLFLWLYSKRPAFRRAQLPVVIHKTSGDGRAPVAGPVSDAVDSRATVD